MLCADFESYIKCQAKVDALFRVRYSKIFNLILTFTLKTVTKTRRFNKGLCLSQVLYTVYVSFVKISLVSIIVHRVFANGLGDLGSIPG